MNAARYTRNPEASLLALWLGVAGLTPSARLYAREQPQNIRPDIGPVELDDVQWQFLPEAVEEVFVGPDDRIWYVLEHPYREDDPVAVRQNIEEQFGAATPLLFGSEPALFETNGRVWFRSYLGAVLFGYDGRNWLEHRASETGQGSFTGTCPNHGCRGTGPLYNLEVGGILFFPDTDGVHTFDGRGWNYQSMPFSHGLVVLRAEPDGRGVLALTSYDRSQIWYYRNGQWQQQTFPQENIVDVLPARENGVWLLMQDETLEFYPLGEDPENAGDANTPPVMPDAGQLGKVHLLDCDSRTGRCFLLAENCTYDRLTPQKGLLTLNGDPDYAFSAGYEEPLTWSTGYSRPIFTPDGMHVWVPGRHNTRGADLLDLATATFVDSIPDPAFFWIHSVRSDGTLFASTTAPRQAMLVLGVYRPGWAPLAQALAPRTYALDYAARGFAIDSTGAVWAQLAEGLSRFDGTQWQTVPGLPPHSFVTLLLPGDDQRMIFAIYNKFFYQRDNGITSFKSLKELIAGHVEDIVANYQTVVPGGRRYPGVPSYIVADRAGHVWLSESRMLSVFIDGQWQSAAPVLLANGSPVAWVEYLNTVGGGGKVYLTDFLLAHSGGKSFFARVEEGRIVVSDAPHCYHGDEMDRSVRDATGALWIPGNIQVALETCDLISGQLAFRVNETGVVEQLENSGWPLLCDRSGTVWLGRIWSQSDTKYNLWGDGTICGQVEIPTADEGAAYPFSDGPGSVYIWTKAGLYHLTASAASGFTDYRVVQYHMRPVVPGSITNCAYSEKGFLVLSTFEPACTRCSSSQYYLVLIPVPVAR